MNERQELYYLQVKHLATLNAYRNLLILEQKRIEDEITVTEDDACRRKDDRVRND